MAVSAPPAAVLAISADSRRSRRPRSWRRATATGTFHGFAATLAFVWFIPILLVILTSFRTFNDVVENGVWARPKGLTLEAYGDAWTRADMSQAMINSFIITLPVVAITIFLASCSAFALSRYRIRFRRTLLLLLLAGNLLPAQLTLIPYVRLSEVLGVFDSVLAVIVVQTAAGLGFYTFVLYGFMRALPSELHDAASLDGAGPLRNYWHVILPLCRPALAALSALAFTWIFNDLLISITLLRTQSKLPTTPAVLSLMGIYSSEWNLIAAATVISAIPCVVVFLAFQKQFIGGLALGGVK